MHVVRLCHTQSPNTGCRSYLPNGGVHDAKARLFADRQNHGDAHCKAKIGIVLFFIKFGPKVRNFSGNSAEHTGVLAREGVGTLKREVKRDHEAFTKVWEY